MSIQFITKDLTTVEKGIIAHGVNCQGVMGSGVAKALRDKWPKIFPRYEQHVALCYPRYKEKLLGDIVLVGVGSELMVANCFTQEFYGKDGRVYADLGGIKLALIDVIELAIGLELPVYLPRIGCGLGGLDWDTQVGVVLNDINEHMIYCNIGEPNIYVCDLP